MDILVSRGAEKISAKSDEYDINLPTSTLSIFRNIVGMLDPSELLVIWHCGLANGLWCQ